MKIINLGRGQGKTTRLLFASEFQDIPILCAKRIHKQQLLDAAKRLGLQIPEPIAVDEISSSKIKEKQIENKDVLIDEAPLVLQQLLNNLEMGKIKAITLTEKE